MVSEFLLTKITTFSLTNWFKFKRKDIKFVMSFILCTEEDLAICVLDEGWEGLGGGGVVFAD